VRDLAGFAIRSARGIAGAYSVTAPEGRETFGSLLGACAQVTGSDAEFVWVPDEQLLAYGVPLWRIFRGVWQVSSVAAQAVGLSCRPLAGTVADTWQWMQDYAVPAGSERAAEIGMSLEREQQILARVA
jgi:2'-hydroxyisoflavone reductase